MEAGSSHVDSSWAVGPSIADPKASKLRLGGSRSSAVSSKFLKDVMYNLSSRYDSSISSYEHTRSLDSHSSGGGSTASSLNSEKVRIVGRGGAGARRRNLSMEHRDVGSAPAPLFEIEPSLVPDVSPDASVLRTVGRGGLGSRPHTARGRGKAGPTSRESSFELLDMRKISKPPRPSDKEARPRASEQSRLPSTNTIRFVSEVGTSSLDLVKVKRKRLEKRPRLDVLDQRDEFELKRSSSLHALRNAPAASAWDDVFLTKGRQNRFSRTKSQRHDSRRFTLLLSSFFQSDSATRKLNSIPTPSSISTLPSQITLTSIATDPSYFFHGPCSRPCTPVNCPETDSTAESSCSKISPSFQQDFSSSSVPSSDQGEIGCDDEDIDKPTPPSPDQVNRQKELPMLTRQTFAMHLSASEADALGRSSPSDDAFLPTVHDENVPTPPEAGGLISTATRSARVASWTGEWNARMVDVIRALRELR